MRPELSLAWPRLKYEAQRSQKRGLPKPVLTIEDYDVSTVLEDRQVHRRLTAVNEPIFETYAFEMKAHF
jgi:hypothetical protein